MKIKNLLHIFVALAMLMTVLIPVQAVPVQANAETVFGIFEDFEGQLTEKWGFTTANWMKDIDTTRISSVVKGTHTSGGPQYLKIKPEFMGNGESSHYTMEFMARTDNRFRLLFKHKNSNNFYFMEFIKTTNNATVQCWKMNDDAPGQTKSVQPAQAIAVAIGASAFDITVWNKYTLTVEGGEYKLYINDLLAYTVNDTDPLIPYGTVGLGVRAQNTANPSVLWADNIKIYSPDNQKPLAPAQFKVDSYYASKATLSWDSSTDNIGVFYYNIFHGDTVIKAVYGGHTASVLTGLTPETEYSFSVSAIDYAGNESGRSQTVPVRTLAPKPELAVKNIIATPKDLEAGQAVSLKAVIENSGEKETPEGTILGVRFKVNGQIVEWNKEMTSSLAAGSTVTLEATSGTGGNALWAPALGGIYAIEAEVDYDHLIEEFYENNNSFFKSITVFDTGSLLKNVASNGNAYRWSGLNTVAMDTYGIPAPQLNDGNLIEDINLTTGNKHPVYLPGELPGESGDDVTNAHQAAGVLWDENRSISAVRFYNGRWDAQNSGVFAADLKLQYTLDGKNWLNSDWAMDIPYDYDRSTAAEKSYIFSGSNGSVLEARGVRVLGKVFGGDFANSWHANLSEVQAYIGGIPVSDNRIVEPFSPTLLSKGEYYVDANLGSDSNTGTSPESPWKSLEKVNSVVLSPGSKLIFKAGSTWYGTLEPKGSGTEEEPILISSYGAKDQRPHINANGNFNAVILKDMEYVTFENFEITNNASSTKRRARGIYICASEEKAFRGIIIRNHYIHDIVGYVPPERRGQNGSIFTDTLTLKARFENMRIENNIIKDVTTRGILGGQFAKNSLSSEYISDGLIIRGNLIDNTGCDGIRVTGWKNALVEYNRIFRVGNNTMGQEAQYIAAAFPQQAINSVWQFNEIAYTAKTSPLSGDMDSQAFDIDHNCGGTHIFQYNYTHNNYGGFMLFMGSIMGNDSFGPLRGIVRYNISQDDGVQFPRIFELHDFGDKEYTIEIYNNTFYQSSGKMAIQTKGSNFKNVSFRNNIFHGTEGVYSTATGISYDNNLYYGHGAPAVDLNAVEADPLMSAHGTGTNGINTISGYRLNVDSPAIDAGRIIAENGGRDFWNNVVPQDTKPCIGAHQAGHVYQLQAAVTSLEYAVSADENGVLSFTINPGVKGFVQIEVKAVPLIPRNGDETFVFTHFREGEQVGIIIAGLDGDLTEASAMAGFEVQASDKIKVFILDDLNAEHIQNPVILLN